MGVDISKDRRKVVDGDRIGWLRNDNWINYQGFTFSLDAPEGHLPSWIDLLRLNVWGYRKGRIYGFLALLET